MHKKISKSKKAEKKFLSQKIHQKISKSKKHKKISKSKIRAENRSTRLKKALICSSPGNFSAPIFDLEIF